MSESRDSLAERLRIARLEAKYEHPTDAARAMGIKQVSTYLGHENGSRGYRTSATRYADFFGVNLEWLLRGRGPMKKAIQKMESTPPELHDTKGLTTQEINVFQWPRDVPILGGAACGEDGLFELNGQTLGYAKRPPSIVGAKDVYALYIYGDSMSEWRENGGLVYVHPHMPVRTNDYVVVQLHPSADDLTPPSYIKRLVKRTSEKLVLLQFNPREEKTFNMKRVKCIHRIIDWDELMGG